MHPDIYIAAVVCDATPLSRYHDTAFIEDIYTVYHYCGSETKIHADSLTTVVSHNTCTST